MLADLDHRPVVVVVNPQDEAFMLEARTPGLCRGRMDAPLVGCLELEDDTLVDESRESLFEDPLVAKGQTGALFLLIAIFGAALGKDLKDM